MNQRLSFGNKWEGLTGEARVANRIREIRPCGMKRGAYGNMNVLVVGTKNRVYGIPVIKIQPAIGRNGSISRIENKLFQTAAGMLRAPYFYPKWGERRVTGASTWKLDHLIRRATSVGRLLTKFVATFIFGL